MMIIDLFVALSLLGSYVRSDEVNTTVTIPPGSALQDYLCSGPLQSNMVVVLEDGEHYIASQPTCNITTEGSVTITGSLDSTRRTVVRCESKTSAVFAFVSVQMLTMERITFINCGILLESIENTLIVNCTFQDSTSGAISSNTIVLIDTLYAAVILHGSTGDASKTDCTFLNSSACSDGAVSLGKSKGNVSITSCTFQNNNAGDGGGAVMLHVSTGKISITDCTFQNNSGGFGGGAVKLYGSTGDVSITGCTFQNNSAVYDGGAVMLYESTSNVSVTDCTFQNNSAGYNGGAVMLHRSTGNVSITDCTFQNNSAVYGGGGAVRLLQSSGDVSITGSTFQNNSAVYDGGAVMLYESTGNVSVTDCTFQNNSAVYSRGGAVMVRQSTGDVSITGSTFHSNSGDGGGVYFDGSTGDVSITDCTFQSNNGADGGGVDLNGSTGDVSITDCTFQNNSAGYGGGSVMLDGSTGDISITDCTFQNNSAGYNGGAVMLYRSTGNVSITDCTFQNNSAVYGAGGAVRLLQSSGDVSITGSTFQNNSAGDGGGAVIFDDSSNGARAEVLCPFQNYNTDDCARYAAMLNRGGNFKITDCTFHINRGYVGGAIYIESIHYNMFRNVSITNNIAEAGAAIYAYSPALDFISSNTEMIQLTLQDVVVKDNHCSSGTCAGAIYFKGVKMDIFGSTTSGSHFSYNSPQGAIQGEGGTLTLHGYITFDHNTGVNGGAISLSNNAPLRFNPQYTIHFSKNAATGYGGAIYNDGKHRVNIKGFLSLKYCILQIYSPLPQLSYTGSITFIDNHALQGGHAVYATPIYDCYNVLFEPASHLLLDVMRYFKITPLPGDINDTQVLSFPENVVYCGCNDPNLCIGTSPDLTTYPGRTVKLNITSVDKRNSLSPSVVYTQVDTDGINSPNIMLGPRQKAQWIGTICAQIEYQIYGPENASLMLLISNDPNGSPTNCY